MHNTCTNCMCVFYCASLNNNNNNNNNNDDDDDDDTFKDHLNEMHFQAWRDKPMHGQYVCNLQDNNSAHSFSWLIYSDLKIKTESLPSLPRTRL